MVSPVAISNDAVRVESRHVRSCVHNADARPEPGSVRRRPPPATDDENPPIGDSDQYGALAVRRGPEPWNCRPQFLGGREEVEQVLALRSRSTIRQWSSQRSRSSAKRAPRPSVLLHVPTGVETTQIACRARGVRHRGYPVF